MAIEFGSVHQLGSITVFSTPNSGAAAARRHTLSAQGVRSGRILIENGSDAVRPYYASGDAAVDCTGLADADGVVPLGATMIVALEPGATTVSVWAGADITIVVSEVE